MWISAGVGFVFDTEERRKKEKKEEKKKWKGGCDENVESKIKKK